MMWGRARWHTAMCDYCDKKIGWSVRRRHWLALDPTFSPQPRPLARRMVCPVSKSGMHDPKATELERAMRVLGGRR